MEEQTFTIKQAAKQTGFSEDTIRFYEKIKLLPQAKRKENGHRIYRKEEIDRIKLISCLKKTGLSLEAMRPFLSVSTDNDSAGYTELVDQLRNHRENIVNQISTLQQLVDFIDIKLKEGEPRQDYSDQSQDEVLEEHKEKAKIRPISVVEMSYFSTSAKMDKSD
ncbi:MerR family transcriptional regulator [Gracilibacillus caseinilyticus]|uniref:MerR family transcriptional regulator n=1 Tax=Gracilibacillus caseinilyticus TaxID=2932256 RepID=A0ABY4F2P7_9BACI|nr:MerR family transcriptional regulator [Gracilibacillus caseinilyticus]UOQ50342.1 MerR family transcriptional regulator [Gracilibacillus caseinilyticus]